MYFLRTMACGLILMSFSACSGSGGTGSLPGGGNSLLACDPGTQVSLARPAPTQSGVGSISSIEMVASGNNSILYQTYQSWQLQVEDSFGNFIVGGNLNLVADPSGPQPYTSDFYYSSSFPALQTGRTYTVMLSENGVGNCTAVPVGNFST